MKQIYEGPFIIISFDANEVSEKRVIVQLSDGYSYRKIHILSVTNVTELAPGMNIKAGDNLTFPVVNSKSPSILPLTISDITKASFIRLYIKQFGQIPDSHYFDKAFEPILVTGEDGNEYKVIPSDQFK